MSNQEAIVDLKRCLLLWFGRGQRGGCDPPGLREAKYFYDSHLAPLIRGEFPDEEYAKIISDAWCRGQNYISPGKYPDWEETNDLLAELKHLWEGQQDKPKGRGYSTSTNDSGTFWALATAAVDPVHVCFPKACGEDRRSGKDRRGGKESCYMRRGRKVYCIHQGLRNVCGADDRRISLDRRKYEIKAEFIYDKPQGICKGIYTDSEGRLRKTRRISQERRQGKEHRCTAIPLFEARQILPFGGYIGENERDPLGWHEDHRIHTRRKAVSDAAQKGR